jgi:hypothetical protein
LAFSFFEELQGMAAQVSVHAAEETLTRDLPRLLEDCAEAIARLPAPVRLLGQRASEAETPSLGSLHHEGFSLHHEADRWMISKAPRGR